MKFSQILPDDPRLTAYALGELESTEAAEVAASIAHDAAAQQAVLDVRTLAEELEAALKDEPILPAATVSQAKAQSDRAPVLRFPFYLVGTAAAAGLAVLLSTRTSPVASKGEKAAPAAVVVSTPASARPDQAALPVNRMVLSGPLANVIPDGFSDLKPAPFRNSGYRLGKSIAANDSAGTPIQTGADSSVANRAEMAGLGHRPNAVSESFDAASERVSPHVPALVYSSSAYAYEPAHGYSDVTGYPLMLISPNATAASQSDVQRYLKGGHLPPPEAVRIDELLNYFAEAKDAGHADSSLAASVEVASAPWNPAHRLVRIGVKGASGLSGSDVAVAEDVKMQIEFNPAQAQSYRLIGYDERGSAKTEKIDPAQVAGGEIDAGHELTALYEVVPVTSAEAPTVDGAPLRYGEDGKNSQDPRRHELLTLEIHYKVPVIDVSRKMVIPLVDTGTAFAVASKDFKLSAAVAGFGMLLKESPRRTATTYDDVLSWAQDSDKNDKSEKRNEFIDLVKKAKTATVE